MRIFLIPFLIIFTCFTTKNTLAQSSFDFGFKDGFKMGFCYGQGVGCMPPLAPMSPLPTLNESSYSYYDGYNRGFLTGRSMNQNSSGQNNSVYGHSGYMPEYKPFIPDYSSYFFSLNNSINSKSYSSQNLTSQQLYDLAMKKLAEKEAVYYSTSNKKIRENYAELIKAHYYSFQNYPDFPMGGWQDSVYVIKHSANYGYEVFLGSAIVENGFIEFLGYNDPYTNSEQIYVKANTIFEEIAKKHLKTGVLVSYKELLSRTYVEKGQVKPLYKAIFPDRLNIQTEPKSLEIYFIRFLELSNK